MTVSWDPILEAESYNVYAVDACGDVVGVFVLEESNLTSTSWTDGSAASYAQRYYKVASVRGVETALSTYAVGKYDVSLATGWNLVSQPLDPTYADIKPFDTSVLKSLHSASDSDFGAFTGSYDFVVGPVDDESVTLASFNPYAPSWLNQNLVKLTEKVTFQILMNKQDTLTVVGRVPTVTNINLGSGDWYWVGYPSCKTRLIKPFLTSALGSLHDGVASNFGSGFDGTYDFVVGSMLDNTYLGTFDPFKEPLLPQNLFEMRPGRGYILGMNMGDSLTVSYT